MLIHFAKKHVRYLKGWHNHIQNYKRRKCNGCTAYIQ